MAPSQGDLGAPGPHRTTSTCPYSQGAKKKKKTKTPLEELMTEARGVLSRFQTVTSSSQTIVTSLREDKMWAWANQSSEGEAVKAGLKEIRQTSQDHPWLITPRSCPTSLSAERGRRNEEGRRGMLMMRRQMMRGWRRRRMSMRFCFPRTAM